MAVAPDCRNAVVCISSTAGEKPYRRALIFEPIVLLGIFERRAEIDRLVGLVGTDIHIARHQRFPDGHLARLEYGEDRFRGLLQASRF